MENTPAFTQSSIHVLSRKSNCRHEIGIFQFQVTLKHILVQIQLTQSCIACNDIAWTRLCLATEHSHFVILQITDYRNQHVAVHTQQHLQLKHSQVYTVTGRNYAWFQRTHLYFSTDFVVFTYRTLLILGIHYIEIVFALLIALLKYIIAVLCQQQLIESFGYLVYHIQTR